MITWDDVLQVHQPGVYSFGIFRDVDPSWYPSGESHVAAGATSRVQFVDSVGHLKCDQKVAMRFMPTCTNPPVQLFTEVLYTNNLSEFGVAPTLFGARIVVEEGLKAKLVLISAAHGRHLAEALAEASHAEKIEIEVKLLDLLDQLSRNDFVCMDMKAANIVVKDRTDVRLIDFDPVFCGQDIFMSGTDSAVWDLAAKGDAQGAVARWSEGYRTRVQPKLGNSERDMRFGAMFLIVYVCTEDDFLRATFEMMDTPNTAEGPLFNMVPTSLFEVWFRDNVFGFRIILQTYMRHYFNFVPWSFAEALKFARKI